MTWFCVVELYALVMVVAGMAAAIIDCWLYRKGTITRRLSPRGCFIMGLLWPVFVVMLFILAWKKKR